MEYSATQRGASDNVIEFSMLSNPVKGQNVFCQGPCGRDIHLKS